MSDSNRLRALAAHKALMANLVPGSPEKSGTLDALVFALANEAGENERVMEVIERYAKRYGK